VDLRNNEFASHGSDALKEKLQHVAKLEIHYDPRF